MVRVMRKDSEYLLPPSLPPSSLKVTSSSYERVVRCVNLCLVMAKIRWFNSINVREMNSRELKTNFH